MSIETLDLSVIPVINLSQLIPGSTPGYVLTWNGIEWIGAAVPTELPSTASIDQVLTWNGSAWIAQDVPTELPETANINQLLMWNGVAWIAQDAPPGILLPGIVIGDVLTWNGTTWISAAPPKELPVGIAINDVLTWNGLNWISQSISAGNSNYLFDLVLSGTSPTDAVIRTVTSKLNDIMSIRDFGATGNGITDDTTAIQNALNYCRATGKKLYCPAGVYLVSSLSLSVTTTELGPICIEGEGNTDPRFSRQTGTIFKQNNTSTNPLLSIIGDWSTGNHVIGGLTIRNMTFYGGTANNSHVIYLVSISSTSSKLQELCIVAQNAACNGITAVSCWNITYDSMRLIGSTSGSATSIGMNIYPDNNLGTVNQNILLNVDCTGFGTGMKFGHIDGTSGTFTCATIIGGQTRGAINSGYVIGTVKCIEFYSCYSELHGQYGFHLTSTGNGPSHVVINECSTRATTNYAIYINKADSVIVTNFYAGNSTYGIHITENATNTKNITLKNIQLDAPSAGNGIIGIDAPLTEILPISAISIDYVNFQGTWTTKFTSPSNINYNAMVKTHPAITSNSATPGIHGSQRILRFNYSVNNVNITGFDMTLYPDDPIWDGQILMLTNVHATNRVHIENNSTFLLHQSSNVTIDPGDTLTLIYDDYVNAWREIARDI